MMKNTEKFLAGAFLASAFTATGATFVIDSVADAGGTIDSGVIRNTPVIATSFTVGSTTYNIDAGATSTNQSSTNSTSGTLFWGAGGTNPGGENQALSDGDILSGKLSGQTANFNFAGISVSDSLAVFFRGSTSGFDGAFDQLPTTVVLVNAAGSAVTSSLVLPTSPVLLVDAGATGFARGTGGNISQGVGGYVFEAADFVFTGGNTFTDVAGVRFPATVNHDPTEVFIVSAVPEPSAWLLGVVGSFGLLLRRRR